MPPKDCSVTLKMAQEDRDYLGERATAEDVSMSAFVRRLLRRDRETRASEQVMTAMLTPPASQITGREVRKPDRRAGSRRLDDKRRAALRRAGA